jgi:hypothetical protein
MELEGIVRKGCVVFDEDVKLPEGLSVKVSLPDEAVGALPESPPPSTDYELFREIIGKAVGLPSNMALNHHHYIRGGPKR